ncbi:MAG TPA: hypothetical protein VGL46_13265 [Pseudonocardiaceae bacterium]|jgi:hypothetical protein
MANRISTVSQVWPPNGLVGGVALDYSVAVTADGDVVDAGKTQLIVTNGSGSSINVTAHATRTVKGLAVTNLVVAVAAGKTELIGPFDKDIFGQPSGANASGGDDQGRVYVDYSAITTVTRAVVAYS